MNRLCQNLIDVIIESHMKLKYSENSIGIHYILPSLGHFLNCSPTREEILPKLQAALSECSETLGAVRISETDKGYCCTVSKEGVRWIHENITPSAFCVEFFALIRSRDYSIEDMIALFQKHSDKVHAEHITDNDEFDWLLYFEDGTPDPYWYCFNTMDLCVTYHRYTKDDYLDFEF